jgi:ribonuclease PH
MSDRRDNLVEIDTLAMRGPIRTREIAQVLAWAAEHRDELIAEWRKYHP